MCTHVALVCVEFSRSEVTGVWVCVGMRVRGGGLVGIADCLGEWVGSAGVGQVCRCRVWVGWVVGWVEEWVV